MAVSYATVTPGNLLLSPARINFNGVDLGASLEGIKINIEYKTSAVKADQYGDTDVNSFVSGIQISVKTALAEVKLKDNWKACFPHASLITSGGNKAIFMNSQIGADALSVSYPLIIHPLNFSDGDLSGDWKFYKAYGVPKSEVEYSPSGQAKISIEWKIFPDFTTQPARFLIHGDPSIGLIAASAGTPAFTGTGNGTCTSVSVYSTSVTETITVKFLDTVSGNDFIVYGSVSGNLGSGASHVNATASSTAAFTSSKISFTITQGSTQFAVNDQFTIAVTAANYV